jgi:hypothetical protein
MFCRWIADGRLGSSFLAESFPIRSRARVPYIVINAAGEPLCAHNGARLEFYTRDEVLPLLMPGERVERIPAFTAEGMIAGVDLPGRG